MYFICKETEKLWLRLLHWKTLLQHSFAMELVWAMFRTQLLPVYAFSMVYVFKDLITVTSYSYDKQLVVNCASTGVEH